MRILHTSDWHLGIRLCDRDRSDEHKEFLQWMLDIIKKESIDILLISGDIFDSTNPPNSAETLYYDFLCSMKETGCSAVVIIGGNHDSISKLNSPRELLKHLSVFVNGGITDNKQDDVISICDKNENVLAYICAIPFLRERDIHIPSAGESQKEREQSVIRGIENYYNQSLNTAMQLRADENIPIIAMGHLFAAGSLSGSGERDLYVGNLGSVSGEIFSKNFSYTALGHIHRSQIVSGNELIRYCGSPLPMDFGEKGEKEVLIVDFENGKALSVSPIPVPLFRKLLRFSGTFDEILMQIDNFENPGIPFWADAEVKGGDAAGDISQILNQKASLKDFEFLRIKIQPVAGENIINFNQNCDIKDLTVDEVFEKRCFNAGMSQKEYEELKILHDELFISIHEEESFTNEN
jgi:exonuclease SbcD